METITLNNGVRMPLLGYGVFRVHPDECCRCVLDALSVGYRSIDTAQAYDNESGVGQAIATCGLPRQELFITTKVWISEAGDGRADRSIDESLNRLRTDYVDLLLVHQPYGDYYGTYRALERALQAGKARAIGVSNFYSDRYVDLALHADVPPAINQLLTNVFIQRHDEEREMSQWGGRLMAWGPLAQDPGRIADHPLLRAIATAHGKTPTQIALRYLVQRGIVAIPKTTHVERMRENIDVFDFALTDDEIQAIGLLDRPLDYNRSHANPKEVRRICTL